MERNVVFLVVVMFHQRTFNKPFQTTCELFSSYVEYFIHLCLISQTKCLYHI